MLKAIYVWGLSYIVPILIIFGIAGTIWFIEMIFNSGKNSVKNEVIKYEYQDLSKSIEIRERSDNCFDAGRVFNASSGECK